MLKNPRFIVIFILLSVWIGYFYKVFMFNRIPVPADALVGMYHPWRDYFAPDYPRGVPYKNFLVTDPVRQQIPWKKLAADSWKKGSVPQWNAYNLGGYSLKGNIQAGIFYPLNVLFMAGDFIDGWIWLIILQPLLSSVFMYIWLRSLELKRLPAIFGSIVWSYGGFQVAWMEWGTIVHVVLWLPLCFWAQQNINTEVNRIRKILSVLLLIFSLTMIVFAGHMQIALYAFMTVVLYEIYLLRKSGLTPAIRFRNAISFVLALSFAFLISSIQILPFMDQIAQSSRIADPGLWQKPGWFMPWPHLVQAIIPDFFGNPATGNYWGSWNYAEFVSYAGVVSFILYLIGIFNFRKFAPLHFWFLLSFAVWIFILPNPLSYVPYKFNFPLIMALQPTRLIFIWNLALSVISGAVLNELVTPTNLKKKGPFIVTLLIVSGAWLVIAVSLWTKAAVWENYLIAARNSILPTVFIFLFWIFTSVRTVIKNTTVSRFWAIIILILLVADLFRFGWKFLPFTVRSNFFPGSATTDFLQDHLEGYRFISIDKRLMPPNTASYYRLESFDGYDSTINRRYMEFVNALDTGRAIKTDNSERIINITNINSNLMPLTNIKYVLSLSDINQPGIELVLQEGETRTYRYNKALPKFYFARVYKNTERDVSTMEFLLENDNYKNPPAAVESNNTTGAKQLPEGEITTKAGQNGSYELETKLASDGYLVASVSYDSGWKAYVDGAQVVINRTNYMFMGFNVPAGSHNIKLIYGQKR